MKTAVSEANRVHSGGGKAAVEHSSAGVWTACDIGNTPLRRSPVSMSADQRTEPKWEETEAVEVFEALARKITEVKACPSRRANQRL